MTRGEVRGVTVRGMGLVADPPVTQNGGARVSAQVLDIVVAGLLLAGALSAFATLGRGGFPAVASGSWALMAGAVAVRRRAPLAAALTALAGLVGYVTHDPTGALPPVAVVLCF